MDEDEAAPENPRFQESDFDRQGLIAACRAFPPLKALCLSLGNIKESGNPRDDLEEVIKALIPFIASIPIQHKDGRLNGVPLGKLRDLAFALADLDRGKELHPLFQVAQKVPNRLSRIGTYAAYDHIIAAHLYLIEILGYKKRASHEFLVRELHAKGLGWITITNIGSWIKYHNDTKNRKNGRPDFRGHRIESDESLNCIINEIAKLLKDHPPQEEGKPPSYLP